MKRKSLITLCAVFAAAAVGGEAFRQAYPYLVPYASEEATRFWEMFSYIATVIAFPAGIFTYLHQSQREHKERMVQEERERQNEERQFNEALWAKHRNANAKLRAEYLKILEILINNPSIDKHDTQPTDENLKTQQYRVYELLISTLENATIELYEPEYDLPPPEDEKPIDKEYRRTWNSWRDYILHWINQPNFKANLPKLMDGEDPEFVEYMEKVTGQKFPQTANGRKPQAPAP